MKKRSSVLLAALLGLVLALGLLPGTVKEAFAAGPTVTISPANSGKVSTEIIKNGEEDAYRFTASPAAGYRFVKWTFKVKGTPYSRSDNPWSYLALSADNITEITAVFETASPPYSVTLSGGANATTSGGATSQTDLSGAMTAVTYTADSGYRFEAFDDITNNGITATRTSDTVVTVSGTPTANATITVPDAVAIPTYAVTYKVVNGTWSDGSAADKTEAVQSGSSPASVPTGMKAADGYTGGAWDTDPSDATITEATTFTYAFAAKQATPAPAPDPEPATHTVTFDANGHGTAPEKQSVKDGEKAARPSDPTADGYTFGGWFSDKDCKEAYDFSKAVTADITLYAK